MPCSIASYRYANQPIERFALKWIQKHIAAFGGDSERVTMYAISTCSRVRSSLEHRSFFLVGARVQVPRPLVYTLSRMMEILRVSSTEDSWYESLWREERLIFFSSHRNPVIPDLCKTSQLNNPCSINSSMTLDALGLPT